VCRAGSREWCLTASLNGPVEDPGGVASAVYREAASILSQMNAEIVRERIFATIELHSCLLAARNRVLRDAENGCLHPITFIQGRPLWGGGFAGVQIYAVQPAHPEEKVWTLYGENGPCGRAWSRSGATFLMLQDLHGFPDKTVIQPSKMEQAGNMFERADRLLHQFGASYRDVVRTWIYLSGILDWYDDFNAVRNARYTAWGLMPENGSLVSSNRLLLPASTGIRGDHPSGAACAMDILAVTGPADARPTVGPHLICTWCTPDVRCATAAARGLPGRRHPHRRFTPDLHLIYAGSCSRTTPPTPAGPCAAWRRAGAGRPRCDG
jgi:hypothetical protein